MALDSLFCSDVPLSNYSPSRCWSQTGNRIVATNDVGAQNEVEEGGCVHVPYRAGHRLRNVAYSTSFGEGRGCVHEYCLWGEYPFASGALATAKCLLGFSTLEIQLLLSKNDV